MRLRPARRLWRTLPDPRIRLCRGDDDEYDDVAVVVVDGDDDRVGPLPPWGDRYCRVGKYGCGGMLMMIVMVMSLVGMGVMTRSVMMRSVMMSVMSPSLLAAGDGGRSGVGRIRRKLVLGGVGRLIPGGCRY